ncbi:MAG: CooT family nickel-binding protein [Bacillota bacterium]
MCEANAYVQEPDGNYTVFLESVDVIQPQADGLLLTTIFGETKFIKGRILRLELVDHKIILQRA